MKELGRAERLGNRIPGRQDGRLDVFELEKDGVEDVVGKRNCVVVARFTPCEFQDAAPHVLDLPVLSKSIP